jgi:chemotaxis protein CheD
MREFIDSHSCNVFLKPGEAVVSRKPILVSTILGSCISVTMFSPNLGVGAICHAMFPNAPPRQENLAYVEPALRHIHRKMMEYGATGTIEVKLFGGAAVLGGCGRTAAVPKSVGEQNLASARRVLEELRLPIAKADTGGNRGRKLLFSMKTGDVYMRRLRPSDTTLYWER